MEVDKQLKFKSRKRMQVEFISNKVEVMTHDCLSNVALALRSSSSLCTFKNKLLELYLPLT